MLLSDIVATSQVVGATRSRKAKTEALAALIAETEPDEVAAVVAWLSGEPLQGRTGTGFRTLVAARSTPAEQPSLTVAGIDATLTELVGTSGSGSAGKRRDLLATMLGAATHDEQEFLIRLLTGELRQGALEGVMTEAIAKAAEVGS